MTFKGFDKDFNITDKVAVVTGAASGIGKAMAELFSEKGAYVVLLDIKEDVKDVAAKINPSRTLALQVDITKKENIEKVVAEIKKSLSKNRYFSQFSWCRTSRKSRRFTRRVLG